MMSKASSLPADEVFLDLEDAVVPSAKEDARTEVAASLRGQDWGPKTVAVRVNAIATPWAADDIRAVVQAGGARLDCIIVPKVEHGHEVMFVDHLLRIAETTLGLEERIGIEAQIETAAGLERVEEIAGSSSRLESLIFGPADMSASLGLPTLSVGGSAEGYPGDHWHHVMSTILVAARSKGLQAVDGPYLAVRDQEGLASSARRAHALGYDGKWVVHPDQIETVNEVFTPSREVYEQAESILQAYETAAQSRRGAVMFGDEMVDEASRKMAAGIVERGRAAGMNPST
jgi:citrate lyase subunit beta / citryl-CoA lyase